MAKSKTKTEKKIPEGKLLKALAELEDVIDKSDALEDADPEGGLSTEGTPLSDNAPRGKADTKKSRRGSSSSSSSMASSIDKADGESDVEKAGDDKDDDSSSDDASSKKDTKKARTAEKAFPPRTGSSSSDESSSDDGDDDDSSDETSKARTAEKSFREVANGDETMAKAIEVSDFIEAMVDQLSLAMLQMAKSIRRVEERLAVRIDNRVAKSIANQQEFNARLAKAVSAIGNSVQDDLVEVVKSLAGQPITSARGKAVLSKGEINQPPWSGLGNDQRMANGSEGGNYTTELSELSSEAIGEWLFKKSINNQIDPKLIMAWEADRYNVETLPEQVRKAIANDLCK